MLPLERARLALAGLSVGDAFGSFFEFNDAAHRLIESRKLPPVPWRWTDDTNMALSVYEILRRFDGIDQDALVQSFARNFDSERSYGLGVSNALSRIRDGESWRDVSRVLFFDEGSFGNDGAMRAAPIGAYYADDLDTAISRTRQATEVTHAHPEGIAGAITVAIAAAYAWKLRDEQPNRQQFLAHVLPHIPAGEVRQGVERARALAAGITAHDAATALGNGSRATAQDTVPFALWCAAEYLDSFEEALWQVAAAGGDVDTVAAMTGSIIVMYVGLEGIPNDWTSNREPLPLWAFQDEGA